MENEGSNQGFSKDRGNLFPLNRWMLESIDGVSIHS